MSDTVQAASSVTDAAKASSGSSEAPAGSSGTAATPRERFQEIRTRYVDPDAFWRKATKKKRKWYVTEAAKLVQELNKLADEAVVVDEAVAGEEGPMKKKRKKRKHRKTYDTKLLEEVLEYAASLGLRATVDHLIRKGVDPNKTHALALAFRCNAHDVIDLGLFPHVCGNALVQKKDDMSAVDWSGYFKTLGDIRNEYLIRCYLTERRKVDVRPGDKIVLDGNDIDWFRLKEAYMGWYDTEPCTHVEVNGETHKLKDVILIPAKRLPKKDSAASSEVKTITQSIKKSRA